MSSRAESISTSLPGVPWIYGPWLDFLVGCGAWSAPLLAIATWMTLAHARLGCGFLPATIPFNYPHFMATIYRLPITRARVRKVG